MLLGDHLVDREILAHIAQEFKEVHRAQPVVVVGEDGAVFAAVETDKMSQLFFHAFDVVGDLFHREQIALRALHRGVADHARAAAGQHDGTVAELLQPGQTHQGDQVSDVKAVGRGVKTDVSRHHAAIEQLFDALVITCPVDKTACAQNIQRILCHVDQILSQR